MQSNQYLNLWKNIEYKETNSIKKIYLIDNYKKIFIVYKNKTLRIF